jgi:hypothetical protein
MVNGPENVIDGGTCFLEVDQLCSCHIKLLLQPILVQGLKLDW